ncbi:DNA polymerase Ligase (LigD) [Teratosphaeria destructans]|uniref:DNA polymerase Ligase (LigD) n=1 Tax=Teratosphaeria destructans TaxID=418781 RepID=A0A9W7SU70_9PEZI|nr:DNA polymerase Ligase (LigD) [Teratosphaeria destructans]
MARAGALFFQTPPPYHQNFSLPQPTGGDRTCAHRSGRRASVAMPNPSSLHRDISPPPTRKASTAQTPTKTYLPVDTTAQAPAAHDQQNVPVDAEPTLAAVEAGQAQIRHHLDYFTKHLAAARRSSPQPMLSMNHFSDMYKRNQHAHGRHFVIHQHDHPISGVHYDLRLQFSESSTISFAVPYGLPGNPNSARPNRMAIETRVHNLWNNLIESASHATGSLLIWDTGEYDVLDRPQKKLKTTDDELSDAERSQPAHIRSQSERLFAAFQSRHIHLRLHGTKLPSGYTIALRLPSNNNIRPQPRNPKIKRRRMDPTTAAAFVKTKATPVSSDTESDPGEVEDTQDTASVYSADVDAAVASEGEDEDAAIRSNNAYSGASNTIGSVHQRHWFLTLDRKHSGFRRLRSGPDEGRWSGPWEAFFVRGRDSERSVVTGRSADQVMEDEGVEEFVGRKMWRPILE